MAEITFLLPVGIYILILLTIAYLKKSDQINSDLDYFLAGRSLGVFPALLSVIAAETSVATIIIFPSVGYHSGYALLWLVAGYIAGRSIVARFYLEKLYNGRDLSIYKMMTGESRLAHVVLSSFYLFAKFISSGVRFFLGGYALHQLFGWTIPGWMLVISVFVAIYSITGGLGAVVVMDQFQGYIIFMMGAVLGVMLVPTAIQHGLALPAWIDLNPVYTNDRFFPALFFGGTVLSIGSHAADQDLLQRILAVRSLDRAKRSMVLSGVGAAIVILIYLSVGYLLRYSGIQGLDGKSPLIDFIARRGGGLLTGFFAILLFAAAMSTLDSAVHSTGAIWKSLFRSSLPGRLWSLLSLVVLYLFGIGFLLLSARYRDFLSLAMGSMNYINGGLIGIITLFTFIPSRVTGRGVILSLVGGFLVTVWSNWVVTPAVAWSWTVLLSAGAAFLLGYGAYSIPVEGGAMFLRNLRFVRNLRPAGVSVRPSRRS